MSFADNEEGWTNVAGVIASIVAAYFTWGGSAAVEAGAGGALVTGEAVSGAYAASAAELAAAGAATSAGTYASYAAMAAQALGGVAAVQSSANQAAAAEYNAGVGVANAQQASMQAGAAEDAQRRRAALVLGEQRAAFAGSGVDPNSGTGLLVQQQSSRNAEMDALNIRYQGLLTGRGLLAQSELDTRQSRIYSQNAMLGAANTGLSIYGTSLGGQGSYLRRNAAAGGGY